MGRFMSAEALTGKNPELSVVCMAVEAVCVVVKVVVTGRPSLVVVTVTTETIIIVADAPLAGFVNDMRGGVDLGPRVTSPVLIVTGSPGKKGDCGRGDDAWG